MTRAATRSSCGLPVRSLAGYCITAVGRVPRGGELVAVHPGRQGARTRGRGSRGLRCTGRPGVRGGRGGAGGLNRRFPLGRRWFAGDWRLLVSIAVVLSIEMRSLLIGESASPRVVRAIERALTAQDGIEHLIHLRTMHLGPEELLVAD